MKILAIETSSKLCGACILENNNLIDKIELNNGLTHSESLMPLIKKLLEQNNLKINNIDAFICDIGPGSFTGIRIGVATCLAFIDSKNNSLYSGVSSLEALAYNINKDGYICPLIDCKNNNCYYALYKLENNIYHEIILPTASSLSDMITNLKKYNQNTITFIGDYNLYKEVITNNIENIQFTDETNNIINTQNLALAGFHKITNNCTLDLKPLYLKKPQAQKILEEKEKNKSYQ